MSKVKSLNHTEGRNRFRFQSFNERLKSLKLHSTLNVRSKDALETPEVQFFPTFIGLMSLIQYANSFLVEELESLKDLDGTKSFREFCYEFTPMAQSLQQILFHKDALMDILLDNLRQRLDITDSILKLVVSIARDLQEEFKCYFLRSIEAIWNRVDGKELDLFEAIDIQEVPLNSVFSPHSMRCLFDKGFNDNASHVRAFTGEALAYLFRKIPEEKTASVHISILHRLRSLFSENKIDGYGHFYFFAVKQVKNSLHSKSVTYLVPALNEILKSNDNVDDPCFHMILTCFELLLEHCNAETFAPIVKTVNEYCRSLVDSKSEGSQMAIVKSLYILNLFLYTKKGKLVLDWNSVISTFTLCLQKLDANEYPQIAITFGLIGYNTPKAFDHLRSQCMNMVLELDNERLLLFIEVSKSLYWAGTRTLTIRFLERITNFDTAFDSIVFALYPNEQTIEGTSDSSSSAINSAKLNKKLLSLLNLKKTYDMEAVSWICAVLKCSQFLVIPHSDMLDRIVALLSQAIDQMSQPSPPKHVLLLASTLVDNITRHIEKATVMKLKEMLPKLVDGFLKPVIRSYIGLEAFHSFLECLLRFSAVVDDDYLNMSEAILECNFGSNNSRVRLATSRIMKTILLLRPSSREHQLKLKIFDGLLSFDELENSPIVSRDKNMHVKKLTQLILTTDGVPESALRCVLKYFFAFLAEKFEPILSPVREAIVAIAKKHEKLFWSTFQDVIKSMAENVSDHDSHTASGDDMMKIDQITASKFTLKGLQTLEDVQSKALTGIACFGSFILQKLGNSLESFSSASELSISTYFSTILQIFKSHVSVFTNHSAFFVQLLCASNGDSEKYPFSFREDVQQIQSLMAQGHLKGQAIVKDIMNVIKILDKPHSLYESQTVYSLCLDLVASGDSATQRLALECIFAWKEKAIVEHEEALKGLTDDVKFRDFLTILNPEETNSVKENDRQAYSAVLIRILFGKLTSRRNKSSDRTGLKARRKAIFAFFVKLQDFQRELFFQLLVQPFKRQLESQLDVFEVDEDRSTQLKYQLGFLNACEDLVNQLQSLALPFVPRLLKVLLYIGRCANHYESAESDDAEDLDSVSFKSARQLALRRLNGLFSSHMTFDFGPYLSSIFTVFIEPKLPAFEKENTQAPSSILLFFKTWSENEAYVQYFNHTHLILQKVFLLLSSKAVQMSVIELVLTLVESILAHDENEGEPRYTRLLVMPNAGCLIEGFKVLSDKDFFKNAAMNGKRDLLPRFVEVIASVSRNCENVSNIETIEETLLPYLKKPSNLAPDSLKLRMLEIIKQILVQSWAAGAKPTARSEVYGNCSYLLSTARTQECRKYLASIFKLFSDRIPRLGLIGELLEGLNSYDRKRLNERDFSKIFDALNLISSGLYKNLDSDQWLPILHNLIYLANDETEFSVRASSSHCLCLFLENASAADLDGVDPENLRLIKTVIMPSIKKAFGSKSEAVRQDFLQIFGQLVSKFKFLDETSAFVPLLSDGDSEASFFDNYYHLQIHRRTRALRRLTEIVSTQKFTSSQLNYIVLPLITHTIFEADRSSGNVLINETISTIAASVVGLSWSKYLSYFLRMVACIKKHPRIEKEIIRIIIAVVGVIDKVVNTFVSDTAEDLAIDAEAENDEEQVPAMEKFTQSTLRRIIPALLGLLNVKDDDNIERRIPLSVSVAKALRMLSKRHQEVELSRLLTTLCNFLKNKRQDVRESTRNSLHKIAIDLGPFFFPFILTELQGSLQKGYQKHVLVYTVHSLLTAVEPTFPPGAFDSSISSLSSILVDDIFGAVSIEREIHELKGKLIEMKSLKGMDCIQLLASKLSKLPIIELFKCAKEIMAETTGGKAVDKLKEYFRRISVGVTGNSILSAQDLLVVIHGLVSESLQYTFGASQDKRASSDDVASDIFRVYLNRNDPLKKSIDRYKANSYLFIEFGFSLLLTSLRKGSLKTLSEDLLDMIDPLVDCLAKSLYSKHSSVTGAALRCLTILAGCNSPRFQAVVPVIFRKAVDLMLKGLEGDNDGIVENSAKLISAILRNFKSVELSDRQLKEMVNLIKMNFQSNHGLSVAFALIRAIMQRKYIFPELYDLMDIVAKYMVTSQSSEVREKCRSAFLEFLLEYPHGNARLKILMNYLVHNTNYEFESGRESVFLLLSSVLSKFSDSTLFDFSDLLFVALVTSIVNDESHKCRNLSARSLGLLLSRLDAGRLEKSINLARKWIGGEDVNLQRAGIHVYSALFESLGTRGRKHWPACFQDLDGILSIAAKEIQQQPEEDSDSDLNYEDCVLPHWEGGYLSLVALSKVIESEPEIILLDEMSAIWLSCSAILRHPHRWIRVSVCQLFGKYFAAVQGRDHDLQEIGRLSTIFASESSISNLCNGFILQLQSAYLEEDHAHQIVKNLVFLAKCMVATRASVVDTEGACPKALYRVFKKLSLSARMNSPTLKATPLMQSSIFKWFAATISLLPLDEECISIAIDTIVRVQEDETRKDNEDAKNTGREILDVIHKKIGTPDYVRILEDVKSKLATTREERRSKRKIQAVMDPETHARRKTRKNELKKESRKRKNDSFSRPNSGKLLSYQANANASNESANKGDVGTSANTDASSFPGSVQQKVALSNSVLDATENGIDQGKVSPAAANPPSGTLLGYSKGVGNLRSREILKNYLREANYLLAHSGLPVPVNSTYPSASNPSQSPVFDEHAVEIRQDPENSRKKNITKDNKEDKSSASLPPPSVHESEKPSTASNDERRVLQSTQLTQIAKAASEASQSKFFAENNTSKWIDEGDSATKKKTGTTASLTADTASWKPKVSLASHLDSIRAVAFLPKDLALVTGSEDGTAKLWNLGAVQGRKIPNDLEPVFTFRGHKGPITSLTISPDSQYLYTGSVDSTVVCWKIPPTTIETYGQYANAKQHTLVAHTDAVWDVKFCPLFKESILATASADSTVKIWEVDGTRNDLKSTLKLNVADKLYLPTSLDWLRHEGQKLAVAYRNSNLRIFDVETGSVTLELHGDDDGSLSQVNKVLCHPTMPMLITGSEDSYLRFYDLNSGET
ncbi:U3 snoRNP protein [Phlyctochytrium planicorne]|nr:U3 snoRNP protein [Phlyctochytrium planicorne]